MSSIPTSSTGNLCLCTCTFNYRIVENFRARNSHKFRSFMAILESFLCEIWGVVSFGMAKTSNSWKFSPQKLYFSPIRESFLREKFPAIQYVRAEGSVLQALVTQARLLGLIPVTTNSLYFHLYHQMSVHLWLTQSVLQNVVELSMTDDLVPYEGCKGLLKVLCSLWSLPNVSLLVITTLIFWLFIKINNYNWYLIFNSCLLYGKHSP